MHFDVYLCVSSTPYTPLDKQAMDNTDEETVTEDWTLDQPLAQTRTTAIVEVKGAVNVVLTPLVAEALDRSDITATLTSLILWYHDTKMFQIIYLLVHS